MTDSSASWLGYVSDRISDIKAKVDEMAQAPGVDADAATDLATAIDELINGANATLRTVYTGLRERAFTVGDALQGIGRAVPVLAIAGAVTDRLQALDARMQEIDTTMTRMGQMGPAGLAEPGVAATVSDRAAIAGEHLQMIGDLVTEIETWLQDSRGRVAEADRRSARALTAGAVAGTAVSLFVAWLNVLLFQQGRRWSRR